MARSGTVAQDQLATSLSTLNGNPNPNGNGVRSGFFDAQGASIEALLHVLAVTNDSGHRTSTALIEEVQSGQREAVDLTKKWLEAPFDPFLGISIFVEATTKFQERAFELARYSLDEASKLHTQTQEDMKRLWDANRKAAEMTAQVMGTVPTTLINYIFGRPIISVVNEEERLLLRDAKLRLRQRERDEAHALVLPYVTFMLHKIGERRTVPASKIVSNLTPPDGLGSDGLVALARLLKAGLIDVDGADFYLTPTGQQALQEVVASRA